MSHTSQDLTKIEAELLARYLDLLVNLGNYPRLGSQLEDLDLSGHDFKIEVLMRCGLFTLEVIKEMRLKQSIN
jgi:hypothetical protein